MSAFHKIDKGLKTYYEYLRRNDYENEEGVGKFLLFCDDNECDPDDINDELNGDAADCIYIDFDETFPFPNNMKLEEDGAKKNEIFTIIKQCYNYGIPDIMKKNQSNNILNEWELQLNDDEYRQYKNMYRVQCKNIAQGKFDDNTLWYGLSVGIKNNTPFAQYLTLVYIRERIENIIEQKENELDVFKFVNSINKSDKTIIIPMIDDDNKDDNKDNNNNKQKRYTLTTNKLIQSVINSYIKRLTPKFNSIYFNTQSGLITDSMECIATCLGAAINFATPTKFEQIKCPFQFDFIIALNGTSNDDSDVDSDDSDDDDNKSECIDYIGDISTNLEENDCIYFVGKGQKDHNVFSSKRFNEIFKQFVQKLKQKYKKTNPKYMENYPHKRRVIAMLDKREKICKLVNKDKIEEIDNKNINTLTFFEPAFDVRDFPNFNQNKSTMTLPEWYLQTTRKCIIPNIGYPKGPNLNVKSSKMKFFLATKNAVADCNGKLLIFSFQIINKNQIKCYMWW
eukprot:127419_1